METVSEEAFYEEFGDYLADAGKVKKKSHYYGMKHNRYRLINKLNRGFFIVPAHGKVLQLDIDTTDQYEQYKYMLPVVKQIIGNDGDIGEVREFKSEKGWHVYIPLPVPMPFYQRVALQCMLGSDPMREAMAFGIEYSDAEDGSLPSMLLFEKDPTAKELILDESYPTEKVLSDAKEYLSKKHKGDKE